MTKFPVGFWNYQSSDTVWENQPDQWAELGMTLTLSPVYNDGSSDKEHFIKILDSAHENNLKIILYDSRASAYTLNNEGREKYVDGLRRILDDFGSHPCVWGVHIGDEPGKDQYPFFCEASRLVREYMPGIEPFINLYPWFEGIENVVGCEDYGEYLDNYVKDSGVSFICYDCYSQMNPGESGWEMYYRNLYYYSNAALRSNVPFWTTLLCIGHFRYRTPNIDDFRWQINTAAAHGAKGLFWFYVYLQRAGHCNYRNAPVNEHNRKTQVYWDLSDNQQSFNNFFADKLLDLTLVKVQHMGKNYGGYPLFEGDDIVMKEEGDQYPPMILSYFKDGDDRNYIMLTNNSCTESVHAVLKIKGENRRIFICTYHNTEQEISGNQHDNGTMHRLRGFTTMPHWLAPGQAILFRYE